MSLYDEQKNGKISLQCWRMHPYPCVVRVSWQTCSGSIAGNIVDIPQVSSLEVCYPLFSRFSWLLSPCIMVP